MKKDILTFLLFVVLAACIWYGHAMQSVRNTRVPVFIHYTGKPGTIGLGEPGLPDTVMVVIRDAGSRLNTYHREPLRLTIDLRQYIHGEKGTIHVPADALRRSISDLLQGTSSLIATTPDEISCPYFTEQERTVQLALKGSLTPAAEYQFVEQPRLSRKTIKIYGQDKTINAIDTIYTQAVALSNLMDTTNIQVALALPTGVRAESDSVNLYIIAERFTEKKFILPIHAVGVPEGYHLHLFPQTVEVYVRVGMSHFAQVQPEDIHVRCVFSPERVDKLDVELNYKNPAITSAWAYPGVVEYILEQ